MVNRLAKYLKLNVNLSDEERLLLDHEIKQTSKCSLDLLSSSAEIYFCGSCGLLGAFLIAKFHKDLLSGHFSDDFIRTFILENDIRPKTDNFVQIKDLSVIRIPLGEMGLFGALTGLKALTGKGFDINLEDVPILQKTIEITDHLKINPYKMISGKSEILVFNEKDIPYGETGDLVKIGQMRSDNDMKIITGDEEGLLNRPVIDEYLKLFNSKNTQE